MLLRHWDPENKYNKGFLKEYQHWVLEVSYRQHTLGCYIIFAKRTVEKISELNNGELQELKIVMVEIESVLSAIPECKPNRFNYMQMGNALHHLHFHGIPRYASERTLLQRKWIDTTYGAPPKWSLKDEEDTIIGHLRDILLSHF
jgi:diadenosine tetraphosphate (Ap4A) HIT family hydrolase